ncbi:MAG: hypothetical protein KJO05_06140 [Bacteroidia bacterium]|nr:hypothetical protein [Bacteroidia bacterium]NNF29777.1 hypothetical protein [Flavobacteriaceae bacterium]MBT8274681.1 hypothetical protein [Bacteroidia bacterium]NNJ82168.1 hypothetical protein [Flavobacteriaceae bacterium]NNK55394.1 hypothetical protein [Flavobacteriaceae bacterium]
MKKAGIWIDSKKAMIIEPGAPYIKTIESGIESRERFEGESEQEGRFGTQFLTNEKVKKNRQQHQVKRFMQSIIDEANDLDSVVLFGPSQMKVKLAKELENLPGNTIDVAGVEAAQKLSNNQLIAWVKDYFKMPDR